MTDLSAVSSLLDKGWACVPLKPGEKRPSAPDWQRRTFTVEDFEAGDNVGNKNGDPSGLIDVDCDAPQAVALAAALLPRTLTHGRPGKRQSHYWYRSTGTTRQFKDRSGEVLIELRSTGSQTMLPPSQHPSGEVLTWTDATPILAMDPEALATAVAQIAVGALAARYWPMGNRHGASGHFGGFLARAGLEPLLVERMVRAVAQAAGDDEVEDRARFARESAEKHARGDRTTGGPSLRDLFGEDIVALMRSWLNQGEDEAAIDRLNERHFVVQIGRSMAVGMEPRYPDRPLKFMTFTDFEQLYRNQYVDKKKLGAWWLDHPRRRSYDDLVFAPPGAPLRVAPEDYNIWRGFVVEPDRQPHPEQRCARYLDHLLGVIATENEAHYAYILDLMADCVQRPGRPPGKALVLRGGMGVGKGLAIETFGSLFGRHFMALNHRDQLVGKFNAHLSGKVVVFADEAIWGGNKADVGTLKHLTTQRRIPVQRKGIDTVDEPNYLHIFIATNESWAWPAGAKERRGVVLDVPTLRPPSYFDALVQEIEQPTFLPALLAVLMTRVVNYSALRAGLDTKALREQVSLSADPVQQWWQQVLEEGGFDGEWPFFLATEQLYTRFTDDMGSQRGAGYSHRGTRMAMIERLRAMLPSSHEYTSRSVRLNLMPKGLTPVLSEPRSLRGIRFPTLEACRREFNRFTGMQHEWPAAEPEQPTLVEEEE